MVFIAIFLQSEQLQGENLNGSATYRFARNGAGEVVDVREAPPSDTDHDYACLGCGGRMIARRGSERVWHFAHYKPNSTCGSETYLHRAGKRIFLERFESGQAIPLIVNRAVRCSRSEDAGGFCNKRDVRAVDYDLRAMFDFAREEAGIDGLRADVLLSNTATGAVLLVEIAVTHYIEGRKAAGDYPVLEIPLYTDDDLARLRSLPIAVGGQEGESIRASMTAFLPEADLMELLCQEPCRRPAAPEMIFYLRRDGFCWVDTMSADKVAVEKAQGTVLYRVNKMTSLERLRKTVLMLKYAQGRTVRNCHLCRFHGRDAYPRHRDRGIPIKAWQNIFCRKHRKKQGCFHAARCRSFSPFESPAEAEGHFQRVDEYAEQRR